MSQSATIPPSERLYVLWGVVSGVLLSNLALAWLGQKVNLFEQQALFGTYCLGYLTAQIGLLAIWCVFANQPMIARVPLTTLLTLVCSSAAILIANVQGAVWREMFVLHASILAMFALAQVSLWIVRLAGRQRIASTNEASSEPVVGHLPMRLLFIMTALVALLLAVSRAWIAEGGDGIPPLMGLVVIILAIAVMWAIGFLFLVTIPSMMLALCDRVHLRSIGGGILAIEWTAGLLWAAAAKIDRVEDDLILGFIVYASALTISMLCGLFTLRWLGYRMVKVDREGNLIRAGTLSPHRDDTD